MIRPPMVARGRSGAARGRKTFGAATCKSAWYDARMAKSIQIRDVPDEDYEVLRRRAAESGLTVPEYLRREVERLAARPTIGEWLERTRRRGGEPSRVETLGALDELRGPWPT